MITEADVKAALPKLAPHVKLSVVPYEFDYRLVLILLHNLKERDKKKGQVSYGMKFLDNPEEDKLIFQTAIERIIERFRPLGFFIEET